MKHIIALTLALVVLSVTVSAHGASGRYEPCGRDDYYEGSILNHPMVQDWGEQDTE
jgi:hypothetical protein